MVNTDGEYTYIVVNCDITRYNIFFQNACLEYLINSTRYIYLEAMYESHILTL